MTNIYPNPLDVYGFCPRDCDEIYCGAMMADKHTGVCGLVVWVDGGFKVSVRGATYEIAKEDKP
jgi:hypothetical protein